MEFRPVFTGGGPSEACCCSVMHPESARPAAAMTENPNNRVNMPKLPASRAQRSRSAGGSSATGTYRLAVKESLGKWEFWDRAAEVALSMAADCEAHQGEEGCGRRWGWNGDPDEGLGEAAGGSITPDDESAVVDRDAGGLGG